MDKKKLKNKIENRKYSYSLISSAGKYLSIALAMYKFNVSTILYATGFSFGKYILDTIIEKDNFKIIKDNEINYVSTDFKNNIKSKAKSLGLLTMAGVFSYTTKSLYPMMMTPFLISDEVFINGPLTSRITNSYESILNENEDEHKNDFFETFKIEQSKKEKNSLDLSNQKENELEL